MVLAKAGRILEVRGFGLRVHAGSSTAMEQLAKSTWIEMLNHLLGVKVIAADSSAGAFTGSILSSYGTWLDDLLRGAYGKLDLKSYGEAWVEAQHDRGLAEFLSTCNRVADEQAAAQLEASQVGKFFLPNELVSRPVFSVGEVVVALDESLDQIYNEAVRHRAAARLAGWDERWLAYDQVKAFENGAIGTSSFKKLMLPRAAL